MAQLGESRYLSFWAHGALALLQFLSAYIGVLGLLLLGGMLGYVEPLWWGGKALIVPLFGLEGLGLAAIPSYFVAYRLLRFEWSWGAALHVFCLGLIQGLLLPFIAIAGLWMMGLVISDTWMGTNSFWLSVAFLLTMAAISSALVSALLMRVLMSRF